MFSDEAQAGALSKVALEDWAGVDIPKRARIRAAEFGNKCREFFELLSKHSMVISITSVTRDEAHQFQTLNTEY
jgi:hypothetical protein